MKTRLMTSVLLAVVVAVARAEEPRGPTAKAADKCADRKPMEWPNDPPPDFPVEKSKALTGITITGRYANYTAADFWNVAWAGDGHLYAGCGDGPLVKTKIYNAGIARIIGDDPLDLVFEELGDFNRKAADTYNACVLVKDGVWYYGMEDGWNYVRGTLGAGRFWGFLTATNYSRHVGAVGYPFEKNDVWTDRTVWNWSHDRRWKGAPDPRPQLQKGGFFDEEDKITRTRNPYFVDFGKENQWSPDGYVYMTAFGSETRPANWGTGDSVYLMRVKAQHDHIVAPKRWEFFSGHGSDGKPVWASSARQSKPLVTWEGKMGHARATYNKPLGRYILCVSPLVNGHSYGDKDGAKLWTPKGAMILESEALTGPWRLVHYLHDFGRNAYCMSLPSKFLGKDGKTGWLLYSAMYGTRGPASPAGGKYAASFHEIDFKVAEDGK